MDIGEAVRITRPTPRVHEAFRRLRERGHVAFVCTGRPICLIAPSLLELEPAGIISSAGACVTIDGKRVFQNSIEPALLHQTVDRLIELKCDVLFESSDQCVCLVSSDNSTASTFGMPVVHTFDEMAAEVPDLSFNKFSYERDSLDKLMRERTWFAEHYDICDLGVGTGEMTVKGINKATGIERALACLGRTKRNSYAFGDSENDLPMLGAVETSIAMGNALPQVKAIADYVTDPATEDGAVTAMEYFGLFYLFTAFAAYIANPALVVKTAGGDNVIVYALTCALSFAVGVTIVYNGVRMILADLVPAFQGISNKLIPGAIPAVDCAIFFPYAPTAVILAILIVVAFAPNFIKTKGAVINHVEEE